MMMKLFYRWLILIIMQSTTHILSLFLPLPIDRSLFKSEEIDDLPPPACGHFSSSQWHSFLVEHVSNDFCRFWSLMNWTRIPTVLETTIETNVWWLFHRRWALKTFRHICVYLSSADWTKATAVSVRMKSERRSRRSRPLHVRLTNSEHVRW